MPRPPVPSLVDRLLDDAALGRLTTSEAITNLEKIAALLIRVGHRTMADCATARIGLAETTVAIGELRRLRPTAQGRRSDITVREEAVA